MFDFALFISIWVYPHLGIGLTANTPSDKHIVRRVKIEGQSPIRVSIDKSKHL